MTPDRIRELATDIAHDAAKGALKELADADVAEILNRFDDLAELDPDAFGDVCAQVTKLAKSATVVAMFPELYVGAGDPDAENGEQR